jgi:hypothetical protein
MFKIVFFDIDGTLLNQEKIIPSNTLKAVLQLKQNGLEVVLATGRAPHHLTAVSEQLGVNAFISFNGAYVSYKGKTIQAVPFNKTLLGKFIQYAGKKNHPLVFSNLEKTVSNVMNHPEVIESFDSLNLNYTPEYQPDFWHKEEIFEVMLYCKAHEEETYKKLFPEFSFVRWHPLVLDVIPATLSKATGIKAMLEYLGIKPEEAIAFGDGLNDKEMLSFVGMGIAMGNSHQDLLPYADMITRSADDDGIPYALSKLGLI